MTEIPDIKGKQKIPDDFEPHNQPSPNKNNKKNKKVAMGIAFNFQHKPAIVLRQAFAALSDYQFNPDLLGFMEVGRKGFEITIYRSTNDDQDHQQDVFGYLNLNSGNLMSFECSLPVKKLVCLDTIAGILSKAQDDDVVRVIAYCNSDMLYFEFNNNNAQSASRMGVPLHDLKSEYRTFPQASFGLETIVPISYLNKLCTDMLRLEAAGRVPNVTMKIKPATISMELGGIDFDVPQQPTLEVTFRWDFWESSRKATIAQTSCVLFLVVDPPGNIILEIGPVVYYIGARFNFDKVLSVKGYYN